MTLILLYELCHRSVLGIGKEDEDFVRVLNVFFFYLDGSKLHNIGCEHGKPVLCEN